jgi:hypothetical protein
MRCRDTLRTSSLKKSKLFPTTYQMEIEQKKRDFQTHHKKTFNILFHIGCGLVYMSLFLSLFPTEGLWIYGAIVFVLFPHLYVFLGLVALSFGTQWVRSLRLGFEKTLLLLVLFYFLPEVSHWITKEETVLKMESISIFDIIDNFFFLYPHSLVSLA